MGWMIKLEQWYISKGMADKYNFTLPSEENIVLAGMVYNHPSILDGTEIKTMGIVSFNGLTIETYDNTYLLGKINKLFNLYLKNEGFKYNKKNPLDIAA